MDQKPPAKQQVHFSLDFRLISAILLVAILVMLFIWKPWSQTGKSDRTISVTGEATITATPDEYVFYPSYQFKNTDKAAALAALTKKSDELVAGLKNLGVSDDDIKTNADGYERQTLLIEPDGNGSNYTLQLTVTVDNKEFAQKVQDYLVGTSPTGSVSPQASFSKSQEKELEAKARDAATKDAKQKAEQTASNLGFSVGKVKSVSDGTDISILEARGSVASDNGDIPTKLSLQPGQNDFDYSVKVTYYIK